MKHRISITDETGTDRKRVVCDRHYQLELKKTHEYGFRKVGETPYEECADCADSTVEVFIEMYGGCIDSAKVFASAASAAEFFIEQMGGDVPGDGPLPGFDRVSEDDYADRVKYAAAMYEAHRNAIEENAAYKGREFYWYEETLKP